MSSLGSQGTGLVKIRLDEVTDPLVVVGTKDRLQRIDAMVPNVAREGTLSAVAVAAPALGIMRGRRGTVDITPHRAVTGVPVHKQRPM